MKSKKTQEKEMVSLRVNKDLNCKLGKHCNQLGLSKNAYLIMLILKDLEQNKSA